MHPFDVIVVSDVAMQSLFMMQFLGRTPRGSCNNTRLLEGFLEGSLKVVLLRRALRSHLVRISVGTRVLRRVLRKGGGGVIEGA